MDAWPGGDRFVGLDVRIPTGTLPPHKVRPNVPVLLGNWRVVGGKGKDEQEALANIKEAIAAWLWAEDQKAISKDPNRKLPEILVSV